MGDDVGRKDHRCAGFGLVADKLFELS
jgi:hypothetical protein